MNSITYKGHIYLVPADTNVMLFYYRRDLFDAAGKKAPSSFAEYEEIAKSFHTPQRTATNDANMREGAALTVPPRTSILNDPAMQQKSRFYPAAAAALDGAATETENFLKGRGYYL